MFIRRYINILFFRTTAYQCRKSVTQAEFTFNDAAQKDFYNLSVVDGFNVAIQITSDKGGPTLTCE